MKFEESEEAEYSIFAFIVQYFSLCNCSLADYMFPN